MICMPSLGDVVHTLLMFLYAQLRCFCTYNNEVLGIALRASWSLQMEIDTAKSIRERGAESDGA